jgi:2-keto-3-deoxy-L-rhamnonate aldolase RhmA
MKEKLARDETVLAFVVRLVRGVEIAEIARTAGFDAFYVDGEHGNLTQQETSQVCVAALEAGITPLVRVPAIRSQYITPAVDGGALGVIAPHVCTAADARLVVKAAKFPPLGDRGFPGRLPHFRFQSVPTRDANELLNEATTVVVQFESAEAVEHAEEIVAVDGVDMVLIGTNDLMMDYGIPGEYDHRSVLEAYAHTIAVCREHGKHVGIGGLWGRPDIIGELIKLGARYVSMGTDLDFLLGGSTQGVQTMHELLMTGGHQ